MGSVHRIRELGRRYLDGEAPPAELAELCGLLRGDDAAADAFAQLARLEADLTTLFGEDVALRKQADVVRAVERSARRRRLWRRAARLALAAGVLFVIALAWWLGRPAPAPEPPIAADRHEVIEGTLLVGGRPTSRLKDGEEAVVAGATAAVVRLSDGSRARLEPASWAEVHGPVGPLRQLVELIEGEGRFAVGRGDGDFQVLTPLGPVTALGTDFTVRLTIDEGEDRMKRTILVAVAVLAGAVQADLAGTSQRLTAGESREFTQDRKKEGDRRPGARPVTGIVAEVAADRLNVTTGGENRRRDVTFPVGARARVTIDGKPAKLVELARGMQVTVIPDEKGAVSAVRAEGPVVTGVLKAVDKDKVTLNAGRREGAAAQDVVHPLAPDAAVLLRGKAAKLTDLAAGQRVSLKLSADRKRVVEIRVGARDEGGRRGRAAAGEIKAIDVKARTITLQGARERAGQSFPVAAGVKVTVDGKPAKLDDLKPGVRALLGFDDAGKAVTAITVGARKRERDR